MAKSWRSAACAAACALGAGCGLQATVPACPPGEAAYLCTVQMWPPGARVGDEAQCREVRRYLCAPDAPGGLYVALGMTDAVLKKVEVEQPEMWSEWSFRRDCVRAGPKPTANDEDLGEVRLALASGDPYPVEPDLGPGWEAFTLCAGATGTPYPTGAGGADPGGCLAPGLYGPGSPCLSNDDCDSCVCDPASRTCSL